MYSELTRSDGSGTYEAQCLMTPPTGAEDAGGGWTRYYNMRTGSENIADQPCDREFVQTDHWVFDAVTMDNSAHEVLFVSNTDGASAEVLWMQLPDDMGDWMFVMAITGELEVNSFGASSNTVRYYNWETHSFVAKTGGSCNTNNHLHFMFSSEGCSVSGNPGM